MSERINAQFKATEVYISAEEEHARDIAKAIADGKPESEVDVPTGMEKTPEAADEWNRLLAAEPHLWRSIARTEMQQALMALTRAIAQPSSY